MIYTSQHSLPPTRKYIYGEGCLVTFTDFINDLKKNFAQNCFWEERSAITINFAPHTGRLFANPCLFNLIGLAKALYSFYVIFVPLIKVPINIYMGRSPLIKVMFKRTFDIRRPLVMGQCATKSYQIFCCLILVFRW